MIFEILNLNEQCIISYLERFINGCLMKVQLNSNMFYNQYLIPKVEATSCAYLNGHK